MKTSWIPLIIAAAALPACQPRTEYVYVERTVVVPPKPKPRPAATPRPRPTYNNPDNFDAVTKPTTYSGN
jgi:hypothetical protein